MGFYLGKSFKAFFKTYPFIIARMVIYPFFAMFAFIIFYLAFYIQIVFPGILSFLPEFLPQNESIYFILLGLLVFLVYWWAFKKYLLFLLKIMHVAVLSEIMKNQEIPSIKAQLSFGLERAKTRFESFAKARLVETKVNRTILGLEKSIFRAKLPGPRAFRNAFSQIVLLFKNAVSFLGEAVFAYIFINDDLDAWSGARDGTILFIQRHRTLFSRSSLLVFFGYFLFALLFFSSLVFVLPVMESLFPLGREFALLMVFLVDLTLYSIFVPPFILCLMTVNYFSEVKSLEPREDLRTYVLKAFPGFQEIMDEAEIKEPSISLEEKGLIETWRAKPTDLKQEIVSGKDFQEHVEFSEKFAEKKPAPKAKPKPAWNLSKKTFRIPEAKKEEKPVAKQSMEIKKLMEKSKKAAEKIAKKKARLEKIIPKPGDLKKKKTFKAFNFFLTQLVEQAGRGNDIEVIEFKSSGKGWEVVAKINGDPFWFRLAIDGAVIEFKEREE